MRKLMALLLCTVILVGATGCSDNPKRNNSESETASIGTAYGDLDVTVGDGYTSSEGTKPSETSSGDASIPAKLDEDQKYKVTIWTSGEEAHLLSAILEFQRKNKNITVNPVNAANRSISALKTAMAAGNAPDIVLMDQVYIGSMGEQGLSVDLSRLGAQKLKSKYISSCWDAVVNGNKIYGLPFSGNVLIMVYNKTVFEAAGVSVPNTYSEFKEVSKKIKSLTGKYAFLPAIIKPDNTSDVNFSAFFFSTWLWRNGGELLTDDGKKAAFNSEAGVRAAEQIVDLLKDGTATREGGEADVYNGNIGMVQLGTWVTQYMEGPNKTGDIGVFMLPELKSGVPRYSGLGLGALCITSNCKEPAAAYKFIEFYSTSMKYQKQSAIDKYNNITGMPSLVGAENEPEYSNPVWQTFFEQFKLAKARPTVDGWEYIELSIARALTAIADGKDAREQLNAAAKEANRILERSAK